MESKWEFDNLFNGMTSNAFKLGTVLSLGWFWMRPDGCMTVYRGQDGDVDYDSVQAVMDINDMQVAVNNQLLGAETIWHFVRCQVSGCGLESEASNECVIRIDDNGDMIGSMPNVPDPLEAEQAAGGKIRLRWRYSPIDQEVAPTSFNVYMDSGSGFDFDTPVDSVDYKLGINSEYTWLSGALTHGQVYRFIVRSDNSSAAETRNTAAVAVAADNQGPAAITAITASWEED